MPEVEKEMNRLPPCLTTTTTSNHFSPFLRAMSTRPTVNTTVVMRQRGTRTWPESAVRRQTTARAMETRR
jgi:hypothetical protein